MSQVYKSILYHGTITEIDHVDVSKGRDNKDFGKGFYMAVDRKQAEAMMHKKYREAVRRSRNKQALHFREYLYEIEVNTKYLQTLNVRYFEKADESWLDFILRCREESGIPHEYDVVIGPTADDDTMLCLKTYWDGLYGKVGSKEAKRILLNNLEPENLGTQYFVGRQAVADKLIQSIRLVGGR